VKKVEPRNLSYLTIVASGSQEATGEARFAKSPDPAEFEIRILPGASPCLRVSKKTLPLPNKFNIIE
jgi:hypothetical protein